jgi:hypothetical protein
VALSDSMEEGSDPVNGELLVETQGGGTMHHLGGRNVVWGVETRNI